MIACFYRRVRQDRDHRASVSGALAGSTRRENYWTAGCATDAVPVAEKT